MMPAMAAAAFSASSPGVVVAAPWVASSGMAASKGIAAMSWNSRMAKALRPVGAGSRLRSAMVCTAIAVEDSDRASPAMIASFQSKPKAAPAAASSAAQAAICRLPLTKTSRRMAHRRFESSSRPIRNSISTTPNSEKCMIDSTSLTKPKPQGPISVPAIR